MSEQLRDVAHMHRLVIDGKEQPGQWQVGMTIRTERLGVCEVYRVHPAGTIDVQAHDGRCYRITGLSTATPGDRSPGAGPFVGKGDGVQPP